MWTAETRKLHDFDRVRFNIVGSKLPIRRSREFDPWRV